MGVIFLHLPENFIHVDDCFHCTKYRYLQQQGMQNLGFMCLTLILSECFGEMQSKGEILLMSWIIYGLL